MSHGTANQESQAMGNWRPAIGTSYELFFKSSQGLSHDKLVRSLFERVHAQTAERVAASVFLLVIKGRPNGPSSVKGERACCVLRIRSLQ